MKANYNAKFSRFVENVFLPSLRTIQIDVMKEFVIDYGLLAKHVFKLV